MSVTSSDLGVGSTGGSEHSCEASRAVRRPTRRRCQACASLQFRGSTLRPHRAPQSEPVQQTSSDRCIPVILIRYVGKFCSCSSHVSSELYFVS